MAPTMWTSVDSKVKDRVKNLFEMGWSFAAISRDVKLSDHLVRRIVNPDVFENYKQKRSARKQEKKLQKPPKPERILTVKLPSNNPLYDPERDGKVFHTTITAAAFGDPLPGRSAADRSEFRKRLESV